MPSAPGSPRVARPAQAERAYRVKRQCALSTLFAFPSARTREVKGKCAPAIKRGGRNHGQKECAKTAGQIQNRQSFGAFPSLWLALRTGANVNNSPAHA